MGEPWRFPISWNAPPKEPDEPQPPATPERRTLPSGEAYEKQNGQWVLVDDGKRKNLTTTDIKNAVRRGAMSSADAVKYLMENLRLDEQEALVLLGSSGSGSGGARARAPRWPEEVEGAQLENELRRAQLAKLGMSAEDTAFEREYRSQRDAINDAFKEAQFAYQKATDTRNFAEQQRQFDLMQKLREQAAALDEKQFQVQTELGYANSRRQDLGVNLQRAETLGYDPDGATGVAPGTLTARAKQQQYANVLGIQDREEQRALQEQARKDQQEQQQFQRGVTIRQLDEGDAAREEQESGVRLDRALRVAAMSKRPAYGRIR